MLQIFKSLGLAAVAVWEYLIKRDVKDVKNAVYIQPLMNTKANIFIIKNVTFFFFICHVVPKIVVKQERLYILEGC